MRIDFNKDWRFDGRRVQLPHDAMLEGKRYAACRNGVQSGFFPGGSYTYEKTFSLSGTGRRYELLFEGVYRNAAVWVNGRRAAFHAYGYTEFTVDISGLVRPGENTITVTADNSLVPNCRWYSGAGLYRPVWLLVDEPEPPVIVTRSVRPAVIEIRGGGVYEIFDGETCVARGGAGCYTIENAKLWSAETPYLYTCRYGGSSLRFGIRRLEWSAGTGLTVNGQRVLLRGGCIHHDNGVLGACAYPDADYRRVKLLKEQGFNALRMAHNPAGRALLDACDQLGMYVMDECFDGWYTPKDYHDYSRQFMDHYREDLRSMVEKDVNHPSVVLYSLGNEVTETAEKRGVELAAGMRDLLHELDPTRPVTCGVNVLLDVYTRLGIGVYRDRGRYRPQPLPEGRGYREKKTGSAFFNAMAGKLGGLMFFMSRNRLAERLTAEIAPSLDIVGLNYASSRYDIDAEKYPDRMMVGTETMAADLPYNWARVKKYPQLIGDFVWAAWDYLGEACIGDWTYHSYRGLPLLAGQGMIDMTGKPLASMAFLQTVWGLRKKPFIAVSPLNHAGEVPSTGAWQFTNAIDSWTWHGCEGRTAAVEVYSGAHSVRLELNGREAGVRRVKNCRAVFRVPYEPGTLTAAALDETGRELSRSSLTTGGREIALTVTPERWGELIYLAMEFTDGAGTLLPYVERPVTVRTRGCRLLGLGSALCKTDESYLGDTFTTYRGRALAVIRAGDGLAGASVTVTGQGAAPVEIKLEEVLR